MLNRCNNHHTLHPPSHPINLLAVRHQHLPHDLQPIPNSHDLPQTRCISSSRHPTTRRVRTHCNKLRPTQSNPPRRRQYTSITGFRQPKASQPHRKRLPARQAAAIPNPALPIQHNQRPANTTVTARASAKRKVGIKRSRHPAAWDPCTLVRPFPPALVQIGKVLEVATSGVAAT